MYYSEKPNKIEIFEELNDDKYTVCVIEVMSKGNKQVLCFFKEQFYRLKEILEEKEFNKNILSIYINDNLDDLAKL